MTYWFMVQVPETLQKVKGAGHKDHIVYDSVSMKDPEQAHLQRQKTEQWFPEAEQQSSPEMGGALLHR